MISDGLRASGRRAPAGASPKQGFRAPLIPEKKALTCGSVAG